MLSLTGDTDNGVITLDGTAPNGHVESNLTFDGYTLTIINTGNTVSERIIHLSKVVSLTNNALNLAVTTIPIAGNGTAIITYWLRNQISPFEGKGGTIVAAWDVDNINFGYRDDYSADFSPAPNYYCPIGFRLTATGSAITWDFELNDPNQGAVTEHYIFVADMRLLNYL